jgi:hypothetical protein
MRLAELTWPDQLTLRDYRKISMRHSVESLDNTISFWLPSNKADPFFEGNRLIIHAGLSPSSYSHFRTYLASCNLRFCARPELWIRADGTIPIRSWFIKCMRLFFSNSIAGQSMHTGGATSLAENGVPPNLIQAAGCWTSEIFNCYMRKSPFLFEALLVGHSSLRSNSV